LVAATPPAPAIAEAQRKVIEAAKLVQGSIEAAEFEGLLEALAETADERLADLLRRRILWHFGDLTDALAALDRLSSLTETGGGDAG
jgi:hypothetical protein